MSFVNTQREGSSRFAAAPSVSYGGISSAKAPIQGQLLV